MEFIFIILSWMILLIPGFDDSVPPTGDKIFKIETSPDIVESIKIQSDESFDLWGFDIILKQNSTGILEIKIPKNLPTPASFIGFWAYDERAYALANGTEINYDVVEDPCYSHYKIPIEGTTNLEIVYSVITAGTWQLYSPIQFDKDNTCYNEVFYKKPIESPLKQFKSGIQSDEITCKEGLELVIKTDHRHHPMCLTPDTKSKMIQRGLAALLITVGPKNMDVVRIQENEAISLIKKQYPQLQDFPSDELPPKIIRSEKSDDGLYMIFETLGSGYPILEAECFLVDNSNIVTQIGHYKHTGGMETNISFKTCN